ncbi:MAG: DUF420 domain-containing protein [Bacteroidota bacterium]
MKLENEYAKLETFPDKERSLKIGAIVVSVVVLLLVGLMRRVKLEVDLDLSFLPAANAIINSLTALMLLLSLYFVKQGKLLAHRNANMAALGLSVVFLACYVAYHFTSPEVIYGDANHNGLLEAAEAAAVAGSRTLYLVILFSHIGLAGIILPFILYTAIYAISGKYQQHKKMARYVWPLWFYVALTGPIVYLLLKDYY